MLMEICLAILTAAVIALVFALIKLVSQVRRSTHLLQTDIHTLSKEITHLLNTIDEYVQTDLRAISKETCGLISRLNDISSDIDNKSRSLNFLFKPLSFLSSKLSGGFPIGEPSPKFETIPQILKWVASSVLLFKTTREFIKNYEKRT